MFDNWADACLHTLLTVTHPMSARHMKENLKNILKQQYFEHIEEIEWAIGVCKETGKTVASTMCIGPMGDLHGVPAADCAVRMARAGSSVGS